MKVFRYKSITVLSLAVAVLFSVFTLNRSCSAGGFIISPINQDKVLVPGSEDVVTIILASSAESTTPTDYEIAVKPFKMNNDDSILYENDESYSQIVDWVTPEETSGTLQPNEMKEIAFRIKVPEDTPAGGQYFAIVVTTDSVDTGMIKEKYAMAHLVYAEVAGETIRKGRLNSIEVAGFISSGDIKGSASITNLGNVHSRAKHTLKVYPLFGGEEYYTNENKPQENVIMPGGTRLTEVVWESTPSIGIFRVEYSVEFEGVTDEISKIVIVCPIWLLVIICALVIVILYRVITGIIGKKRREE
ncbi:hypothetical protein IK146_00755 [Candidatus Saccharibacteria bacterium]|nr:hypothetical protein [Candidatus Saccharibacteria bacterium]